VFGLEHRVRDTTVLEQANHDHVVAAHEDTQKPHHQVRSHRLAAMALYAATRQCESALLPPAQRDLALAIRQFRILLPPILSPHFVRCTRARRLPIPSPAQMPRAARTLQHFETQADNRLGSPHCVESRNSVFRVVLCVLRTWPTRSCQPTFMIHVRDAQPPTSWLSLSAMAIRAGSTNWRDAVPQSCARGSGTGATAQCPPGGDRPRCPAQIRTQTRSAR
jgi:hypothetical protein